MPAQAGPARFSGTPFVTIEQNPQYDDLVKVEVVVGARDSDGGPFTRSERRAASLRVDGISAERGDGLGSGPNERRGGRCFTAWYSLPDSEKLARKKPGDKVRVTLKIGGTWLKAENVTLRTGPNLATTPYKRKLTRKAGCIPVTQPGY